jgi:hypothetical protein
MSNLSFGDDTLQRARDEHTELLQLTRHYSGLRFVMLPIFVTVTAGLLSARFGSEAVIGDWWLRFACAWAGIIIVSVFIVYEIVLSKYLSILGKHLRVLEATLTYLLWGEHYVKLVGWITMANLIFYAFLLLFWIYQLWLEIYQLWLELR